MPNEKINLEISDSFKEDLLIATVRLENKMDESESKAELNYAISTLAKADLDSIEQGIRLENKMDESERKADTYNKMIMHSMEGFKEELFLLDNQSKDQFFRLENRTESQNNESLRELNILRDQVFDLDGQTKDQLLRLENRTEFQKNESLRDLNILRDQVSEVVNKTQTEEAKVKNLKDKISTLESEITILKTQEPKIYYNNFKSCTLLSKEGFQNYTESSVFSSNPLSIGNIMLTCSSHFIVYRSSDGRIDEGSVGVVSDREYWDGGGSWCDPWGSGPAGGGSSASNSCIGASQLEPYEE